jgi:hypothetical protein
VLAIPMRVSQYLVDQFARVWVRTAGRAGLIGGGGGQLRPGAGAAACPGNPLAAGLIAFGAGWLVASLLPATEPEQQVAWQARDLAAEKVGPVAQQLGQTGREAAQELRDRPGSAADVTSHA